jgi:hypothetical protein
LARGSEIIAFFREWPVGDDFYREDGFLEEASDGSIVGLDPSEECHVFEAIGVLIWQGDGPCPSSVEINGVRIPIDVEDGWSGPDPEAVFRAWRGDRRRYLVMVEPRDVAEFESMCAEKGWTLEEAE